jgi:hypothetical protein
MIQQSQYGTCIAACLELHQPTHRTLPSALPACCAVLCCAVLCCAVLCCAVLCCAVLCCALLATLATQWAAAWVDGAAATVGAATAAGAAS